jgi:hypothetical protein
MQVSLLGVFVVQTLSQNDLYTILFSRIQAELLSLSVVVSFWNWEGRLQHFHLEDDFAETCASRDVGLPALKPWIKRVSCLCRHLFKMLIRACAWVLLPTSQFFDRLAAKARD